MSTGPFSQVNYAYLMTDSTMKPPPNSSWVLTTDGPHVLGPGDQPEAGPEAVVKRVGRWTYRVQVVDGIGVWGPDGYGWYVLGRGRAVRKARKVLARYRKLHARNQEPVMTVR